MTTITHMPKQIHETFASDFSATISKLWPDNPLTPTNVLPSLDTYLEQKNEAFSGDIWRGVLSSVVRDSAVAMLAPARGYREKPKESTEKFEKGIITGAYIAEAMSPAFRSDIVTDPILQVHTFTQKHRRELGALGLSARIDNFRNNLKLISLGQAIGGEQAFATHTGIVLVIRSIAAQVADRNVAQEAAR